jgi:MFS transporter, DHA1 family, tetracycline resistance protein
MNSKTNKIVLFLTLFIDLMGFGLVLPLLPLYAQHYGAKPYQATLLVAVYSLMQFFYTPFWGSISDKYGRRPVILFTLFGTAVAYIGLGFSNSLDMLFFARSLAGMMGGNISVVMASMADITTPENRSGGIGFLGAGIGFGLIFGPAIGGILAGNSNNPNFHLPCFVATALSVVTFILAVKFFPESLNPATRIHNKYGRGRDHQNNQINLQQSLGDSPIAILVIMSFLAFFPFSCTQSILPLWLKQQFSWEVRQTAYLFTFIGVISAIIQGFLVRKMTKYFGERKVLILGVSAFAFGLLLLPLSKDLFLLLPAITLVAAGFSLTQTTINSLTSQYAGAEQGKLLGITNSSAALARITGPTWAGFSFENLGYSTPFISAASIVIVAVLISLFMIKNPSISNSSISNPSTST